MLLTRLKRTEENYGLNNHLRKRQTTHHGKPLHVPKPLNAEQQSLVLRWGGLPVFVIRRSFSACPPGVKEELELVGNFALVESADRFDASRGVRFDTFACNWIWGRMVTFVREECRRKDTQFLEYANSHGQTTPSETLIADPSETPEFVEPEPEISRLQRAIAQLPPRKQLVLKAAFGIDGEKRSLVEIGVAVGVCKERVRQIRDAAIREVTRSMYSETPQPRSRT